jgi:hypothetical protein
VGGVSHSELDWRDSQLEAENFRRVVAHVKWPKGPRAATIHSNRARLGAGVRTQAL